MDGGPSASTVAVAAGLGGGHVGLIERLDAEQRTHQGRGQLPQQHLAAEVDEMAAEGHHGHRVAGLGQGVQLAGAEVVAQRHEQPVVAVCVGPGQRLAHDRHHAGAVLAGRLGEELLEPQAERGLAVGHDDGQLVAALGHPGGDGGGQAAAGLAAADARSRSDMADAAPSSPSTSAPTSSAGTRPNSDRAE